MTTTSVVSTRFRCQSQVHGIMKEYPNGERLLEVRCKDKWCADRNTGEVAFHYFNPLTGKLVRTVKYRDPVSRPDVIV